MAGSYKGFRKVSDAELMAVVNAPEGHSEILVDAAREEIERRGGMEKVEGRMRKLADKRITDDPSRFLEFKETKERKIRRGIRWGMWSAYASAGVAALLAILLFVWAAPALPSPEAVARLLFYGTLFLGLGFGIFRNSRICAVLAFMVMLLIIPVLPRLLILPALVALYGLIRGVLGTFAYHKHLVGGK
ncbi:MAG: hypothetical protein ABI876_17405 [Bacteroidota bacterium]